MNAIVFGCIDVIVGCDDQERMKVTDRVLLLLMLVLLLTLLQLLSLLLLLVMLSLLLLAMTTGMMRRLRRVFMMKTMISNS